MKNNLLKQLLKLKATALACAVIVTVNLIPVPSVPGNIGNSQELEIPDTENNNEEPGISPQNDKDYENMIEVQKEGVINFVSLTYCHWRISTYWKQPKIQYL